jgi:hypothetical protein
MRKPNVNFVVDAAAFAALLGLISTGMVLAFKLPPGSGGREPMGGGRGAWSRPVETLWGWTRHDWGEIHLWIAGALLAALALHLLLHAKWIFAVVRGRPSNASRIRLAAGALVVAVLAAAMALPWLATTESQPRGPWLLDARPPRASTHGENVTQTPRESARPAPSRPQRR